MQVTVSRSQPSVPLHSCTVLPSQSMIDCRSGAHMSPSQGRPPPTPMFVETELPPPPCAPTLELAFWLPGPVRSGCAASPHAPPDANGAMAMPMTASAKRLLIPVGKVTTIGDDGASRTG